MSNRAGRALAHLIFDSDNWGESLHALVGGEVEQTVATGHLLIVLGMDEFGEERWDALFNALQEREDKLGERARWFATNELAEWGKVSARTKGELVAGLAPTDSLTFEQTVDLLAFPLTVVRRDAVERLFATYLAAKRDEPGIRAIVELLSEPDSRLTRAQVLSLISLLQLKGAEMRRFVNTWFDTSPDPSAVALVVRRRTLSAALDPFTARAVNYLKEREWSVSREELALLSASPEPLLRALAYSKLDAAEPEERKILEDALTKETSPRLKEAISVKLKDILL